mmetsp:Transcript_4538/g.10545  ORF Transcript_4538/g.10545 Transcript_4538/m.10545 type:complete len:117 (+) Transcript_4538:171-521(+)
MGRASEYAVSQEGAAPRPAPFSTSRPPDRPKQQTGDFLPNTRMSVIQLAQLLPTASLSRQLARCRLSVHQTKGKKEDPSKQYIGQKKLSVSQSVSQYASCMNYMRARPHIRLSVCL